MKPYAVVFGKDHVSSYSAAVYKDSDIICFNKDKIFEETSLSNLNNIKYRNKRIRDFAFIINMYYL